MGSPAPRTPDVPTCDPISAAAFEAEVERRVAARFRAEAWLWRFRLVLAETMMMGLMVALAGLALRQAPLLVARASLIVSASCLATGLLLLCLSGAWLRLCAHVKKGRRS